MRIEIKITDDNGNISQYSMNGSLPTNEDAYREALSRKRRHEKNIIWKAKIFAAGAMWAKMKLTGISDIIGAKSKEVGNG